MANGTRMRQMETQLQQVTTLMVGIQNCVEMMEEKIGSMVDQKLEVVVEKFLGDMREQIREEMRE